MTDFRKMERELASALDAAGINVLHDGGNVYAVVASVPGCTEPNNCKIEPSDGMVVECFGCELRCNLATELETISITALAKRLADA